MSTQNNVSADAKRYRRTRADRSRFVIRLIALILCALMVLGVAYYAIVLLTPHSYAADPDDDAMLISVGIMYGDGVSVSYPVSTIGGVTVGLQSLADNKEFTSLWTLSSGGFVIADDANLKYSQAISGYELAESKDNYSVGGYHIQLSTEYDTYDDAAAFCATWSEGLLTNCNTYAFPVYDKGAYRVRIGDFYSTDELLPTQTLVTTYFTEYSSSIISPSATGVSAIDPATHKIVFEFDNGTGAPLGIKPTSSTAFLKSPAGNTFSGTFAFKRYANKTEKVDGVSVINVLPLEDYVAGVLPYEVSGEWPLETLKAFAITVRSFTVSNLKRHYASYSCDLCSTTHCQVYRGTAAITEKVKTAVSETRGQVMTSGGKICIAFYSSSVGGITVGAHDAWGGNDETYLKPKRTPWEDYYNHSSGFNIVEISPTELLAYLRDTRSYSELKGTKIADIKVLEYGKDSTYVKTIKFTDDLGNSVTVTNTDKVRTVLSTYLKSANFVVGKGKVDYFVDIVRDEPLSVLNASDTQGDRPIIMMNKQNTATATATAEPEIVTVPVSMVNYSVRTGTEQFATSIDMFINVMTADGVKKLSRSEASVICVKNPYVEEPEAPVTGEIDTTDNKFSIIKNMTVNATSPDNYIFVSKGWGHGVGMSQWGAYDLANFGYNCNEILTMYYDGIKIENYESLK